MPISRFSDVDGSGPSGQRHLVASLTRRAGAVLYEPYRAHLAALVDEMPPGLVVDVGAGTGTTVVALATRRPVIGVEPSSAMVEEALRLGRPVVLGAGNSLPFPDSCLSGVILERVLQHVPGLEEVLSEAVRVLAPGGSIVAVDPWHSRVSLDVPGLEDLARRLCAWKASRGFASPDAVERTKRWAHLAGAHLQEETFLCSSSSYREARVLTDFPEWARLARESGADVAESELEAWSDYFATAAEGKAVFCLFWPVTVSLITPR